MAKKAKKTTKKKTAAKKTATKKTKTAKKTKTVAKKTAAAKNIKTKARRTRKKHLTKADLQKFTALLLLKRAELVGDVSSMEAEALRKSRLEAAGDLSSMPIHMADIGTDNFEQEFALGLMDSERKILIEINLALKRIEDGTYGICEGTGQQIPKARLLACPWAKYCVEYASMVEKGIISEGEKTEDYIDLDDFDDFDFDDDDDEDELEMEDDFEFPDLDDED